MKSLRLTMASRQDIASNAVESKFASLRVAIKKKEMALGERLYDKVVPRAVGAALSCVPKDWLCYSSAPLFAVPDTSIVFRCDVSAEVPVPHNNHRPIGLVSHADHEEFRAIRAELNENHTQRKNAYRNVLAMLTPITTLQKLELAWPEGAEFYAFLKTFSAPVPAVRTSEVNALLGLPKDK